MSPRERGNRRPEQQGPAPPVRRPVGPFVRRLLLGPPWVARSAAATLPNAQERWLLRQPREVRRSFVREVVDKGDDARLEEIWMLRRPKAVRESYIREVLER